MVATSNKHSYVKNFMDALSIILLRIIDTFPKPIYLYQELNNILKPVKANLCIRKIRRMQVDPPFDIRMAY